MGNTMKKILVTIFGISIITCILYFSLTKLINSDVALYKVISTETAQEMIDKNETFILYLYQKNCASCRQVKPIINDYIRNTHNEIFAIDINADENKNYIIQDLNIQGTPTVIFYNSGKETGRFISVFSKKEFEKKAKENGM